MVLFRPGELTLNLIFAPTLDFIPGNALSCAVSFDEAPPTIVKLDTDSPGNWDRAVMDSVRTVSVRLGATGAGYHVLKYWMVDPAVVLEKIVVNTGGLRPSYLGPPESTRGPIPKLPNP